MYIDRRRSHHVPGLECLPLFDSRRQFGVDKSSIETVRGSPVIASGPILIVVDEMEILDFSGDAILEGNLERIFEILRNQKGSAITKSLFTTLENSVLMMDVVGWERTVDASLGSESDGFMTLDDFASLRM
jgi:hypothetical protein